MADKSDTMESIPLLTKTSSKRLVHYDVAKL